MNKIIYRDYNRTIEDDFKLNVEDYLLKDNTKEAIPIYYENGLIEGWKIQNKYE